MDLYIRCFGAYLPSWGNHWVVVGPAGSPLTFLFTHFWAYLGLVGHLLGDFQPCRLAFRTRLASRCPIQIDRVASQGRGGEAQEGGIRLRTVPFGRVCASFGHAQVLA